MSINNVNQQKDTQIQQYYYARITKQQHKKQKDPVLPPFLQYTYYLRLLLQLLPIEGQSLKTLFNMQKLEIEEIEPFQVDYPSPTTIVVKKERPGFGISGLALIALGVVMLCFVVVFARYEKK